MNKTYPPLGVEDSLNQVFADTLVDSPEFSSWVLSQTKFAEFAAQARLLHDEQAMARDAPYWWRFWHCKMPHFPGGGEETDIFAVFERADSKDRFALLIENKLKKSRFEPNQAQSYSARGEYMKTHSNSAKLKFSDFDTVLMAPNSFRDKYRGQCDHFGCFISHEAIAKFISDFGDH